MKLILELVIIIARLLISNRHNKVQLKKVAEEMKEGKSVTVHFAKADSHKNKFNVIV